jgi:hypothetical protein
MLYGIEQVKSLQEDTDLSNEVSICNAKRILLEIKDDITMAYGELNIDPKESASNRLFSEAQSSTIRHIHSALTSLHRCLMGISHDNEERTSKS